MKIYVDYAVEEIIRLCNIPSPTGFTKTIREYLANQLRNLGFNPDFTTKGSVLVDLGGSGNPLVLTAHVDTLGAMVRALKPNGRIRIAKIGGYPENNIEGENCIVHTRAGTQYTGTIQLEKASSHVHKDIGDIKRDDASIEVVLDEKVKTREEVAQLGIQAGDFISFDPRSVYTTSGFIKSRHLDDKASCGILLALAQFCQANSAQLNRKVYLLFTAYEEVGHGASSGLPPDIREMISVDMGAVGDDLETDEFKVSICAKDSGGPYDYDLVGELIAIAQSHNLSYAVDVYPFYKSDADAALVAGYDIRHGLIGPGVAASHGYERTHYEGIANTLLLLKHYISA